MSKYYQIQRHTHSSKHSLMQFLYCKQERNIKNNNKKYRNCQKEQQ